MVREGFVFTLRFIRGTSIYSVGEKKTLILKLKDVVRVITRVLQNDNFINLIFKLDVKFEKLSEIFFTYS